MDPQVPTSFCGWCVRSASPSRRRDLAQLIKEMFSLEGKNYTIILFTQRGKTLERFLSEGDPSLRDQASQCGNRYLAFDNKAERGGKGGSGDQTDEHD